MPIQLDAKLNAFRRSPKGFYITLEVAPDCDWQELAAAPLGQAFGVAMVAYDAETGKAKTLSPAPDTKQGEAGKTRKPWSDMSRAQQAGILCNDTTFRLWLSNRGVQGTDAADALRNYLRIRSRSLLDEPEFRSQATKFDALVAAYRQEIGQMAEQRA